MPSSSQLVQEAGFGGLAEAVKATQEDQARQQLLTAGCLAELATRFKHLVSSPQEDAPDTELLDLARLLRNSCAGGSDFKTILVAGAVATAAADWAVASAAGIHRRVAVQLLVNLATEDYGAAVAVADALSPAWAANVAAELDGLLLGPFCRLLLESSSCYPDHAASQRYDNKDVVPAMLRVVSQSPELGQALPDFMAFMHLTIVLSNQLGALLQMVMQEPSASPGSDQNGHAASAAGDLLVTLLQTTSAVLSAVASGASPALQSGCGPAVSTCAYEMAALLPQLLAAWVSRVPADPDSRQTQPYSEQQAAEKGSVARASLARSSEDDGVAKQVVAAGVLQDDAADLSAGHRSIMLAGMSEEQLAACLEELLQVLSTVAGMEAEECRGAIIAVSHHLTPLLLGMLAALGPVQRWRPAGNAAEQEQQPVPMPPAVQTLADTCPRTQPFQGYRTAIIAVLANSCFQRPSLQTAVHDAGGTYLLLSQCQVDDKSPLTREWAVLATRNLCEGRPDIQASISELQAVSAGRSQDGQQVDVNLSVHAATGKVDVTAK